MEIHSVKIDSAKRVTLAFSRPNKETLEKIPTFSPKDEPTAPFVKAVRGLQGDLCYLTELPKEMEDRITVLGANFGEKGGRLTCQFVFTLSSPAGSSTISSPVFYAPAEGKDMGPATMTNEQVKRLNKVATEAKKYADGNRTQLELPVPEEVEEEVEVEAT